jgi:hypothetical protein
MTSSFSLITIWLRAFFIVLAACIPLSNIAYANDDAAIKDAFMKGIFFNEAVIYKEAMPWQIVEEINDYEATVASLTKDSKKILMRGITGANGEASLTSNQRETLFNAWKRRSEKLWYVPKYGDPWEIRVVKKRKLRPKIQLIDVSRERAEAESDAYEAFKKERDAPLKAPLNKAIFTQAGFDEKPFAADFADWQKRFKQDIEAFNENMGKDGDYGKKLLEDKNQDGLKKVFAKSIHAGSKNLSRLLIESPYERSYTVASALPHGQMFIKIVLAEHAKPVGFGGTFDYENTPIEMWYMVFEDIKQWSTVKDFKESVIFEAFEQEVLTESGQSQEPSVYQSAELPPYKTVESNRWPALHFVRGADGKIMLFGFSEEMATILYHIENRQLY